MTETDSDRETETDRHREGQRDRQRGRQTDRHYEDKIPFLPFLKAPNNHTQYNIQDTNHANAVGGKN